MPPPRMTTLGGHATHGGATLSLAAAMDEHARNAAVLNQGCEKEFLEFVRKTQVGGLGLG